MQHFHIHAFLEPSDNLWNLIRFIFSKPVYRKCSPNIIAEWNEYCITAFSKSQEKLSFIFSSSFNSVDLHSYGERGERGERVDGVE